MRSAFNTLLTAVALAGAVVPAAASTVTYTITGTVIAGGDRAGLFGGGDLTGDPFTALEVFDTSGAQWSYANADGSGATGGWLTNGRSFAQVTLTIGSGTTHFSDYTSTLSSIGGSQFNAFVQSSSGANKNDIGFYIPAEAIQADYTRNNTITGLTSAYAGYYTLNDDMGRQVDWANFEVTGLAVVTAVPLPGAAPLFGAALLGLAAVGYRAKRRAPAIPARDRG